MTGLYDNGRNERPMKIRVYLAVLFVFSLALGSTQARVRPQRTAPPDITAKAVAAAKVFLATLDARQQAAVVVPLNKDTRSRRIADRF